MSELVAWKNKGNRKPLILNGAHKVGKTWLLKEFDRTHFTSAAYVSLDANKAVRALFDSGFDMKRIINGLSLLSGEQINSGSTLIILKRKKMV
jgi:predicted AAA+ superfamily ATPase